MRKTLVAVLSVLALGGVLPAGATAEVVEAGNSQSRQNKPKIKEGTTPRDCPDLALCFFKKYQFHGTIVYYESPVKGGCNVIPRRPMGSVINYTHTTWRLYRELDCRGDYTKLRPGQAGAVDIGVVSWN